MNNGKMIRSGITSATLGALVAAASGLLHGQTGDAVTLQIKADQVTAHVSPALYGLMTEEINYSYDGGLYAELVRNRSFKEDAKDPVHWHLVQEHGGTGSMALDPSEPFNDAIATSLMLTVTKTAKNQQVGIANEGFWGIPVKPHTRYRASFYAKAVPGFAGPVTVAVVSNDGATTFASAQVPRVTGGWRRYEATLTTGAAAPSVENRLVLSTGSAGTLWFNMVSLFPPTYKNRANGNRQDIMQLLADMHPAFLRFPGGNYLEGNTIATRFDWKKTIGDVSRRPGHMDDAWKYWSSDGMGLLEFLNWCEDLQIQPLLAVYAGYSLHQERVAAGEALEPYVKEALEEIEYVTGDATTTWGAQRAKDGHPAPFKLEYVEVGNEDQFDRQAGSYDSRFTQFFDAIRAKYPQLKIIATDKTTTRTPDVIDEHFYRGAEDMASHSHDYDTRARGGPKVFVGEWATRVGEPTPNMTAALGDAAWMTGMERNSDLVIMSCYAPLFVNVNKGAMQWRTDLIGYDALNSYGSPAYYAQQMFSWNHGDEVLSVIENGVPTQEWQPPAPRRRPDSPAPTEPPALPPVRQVPMLFFDATRDSKTGTIYVKVVNRAGTPQPVRLEIAGLAGLERKGQMITLKGDGPDDTNSISAPAKIVPVTTPVDGISDKFSQTFPAYSVTVLQMKAR
ncbi:MAG: alpha-N-arabinofuranosidase [Bryobacterales bacterium]|nr:alpha-N-arabinofuranosidase [Bryobacterales bacterium]